MNEKDYKTQLGLPDFILLAIWALSLVVTAISSVDMINQTMPADSKWLGWLSLGVVDVGAIGWIIYFLWGNINSEQRAIANTMRYIDLAAACALFAADRLYRGQQNGAVIAPAELTSITTWLFIIVTIVNLFAISEAHTRDTASRYRLTIRDYMNKVNEAAFTQLGNSLKTLAPKVAYFKRRQIERDLTTNELTNIQLSAGNLLDFDLNKEVENLSKQETGIIPIANYKPKVVTTAAADSGSDTGGNKENFTKPLI